MISTYKEADRIQAHLSPDKLKLLTVDERRKLMKVHFLHDTRNLVDSSKTIPLESESVSVSWFSDSE